MKTVEFEIFSKDLTVDAREELERAATVGESMDLMFDDLNEFAQQDLLDAQGIETASDMNWEVVPLDILDFSAGDGTTEGVEHFPLSILTLTVLGCPNGGDESDDCADCAYAGDYHFCNGECVRRFPVCDGECDTCGHQVEGPYCHGCESSKVYQCDNGETRLGCLYENDEHYPKENI